MSICIRRDENGIEEWGAIELQGDLEFDADAEDQEITFGDLAWSSAGKPLLRIGHHLLEGREVTIDKPMALLERVETTADQNDADDQVNNIMDFSQDSTLLDATMAIENKMRYHCEYIVRAVIKKKLIFSSRPTPIVTMK